MDYRAAFEVADLKRIEKLNKLTDTRTYWDDVRKMCKRVQSDHAINCWERLADMRWAELVDGIIAEAQA